ncbi:MAG: AAA family ATPase, partial [Proteobacteria bacterium]|nr:AAA family ATPase [Pseudomonadota bacterium]
VLSKEAQKNEAFFHTLFYLMLCASGADSRNEVLSSGGRLDLAVFFPDRIFVIEFKCDRSAAEGLEQIKEKGYHQPFLADNRKLLLMGVNFDSERRVPAEWKVESCGDD